MNTTNLIIVAVLVSMISIAAVLYFVRKLDRKNTVRTETESTIQWKNYKCVNCGDSLTKGYAFAGKGINWTPENKKRPGIFSTIGSVLINTISFRIPPALNKAWYCERCNLVVIDNSAMVIVKPDK